MIRRFRHENLPGLQLHPLKGSQKGRWAVSVSGNWQVTSTAGMEKRKAIHGVSEGAGGKSRGWRLHNFDGPLSLWDEGR